VEDPARDVQPLAHAARVALDAFLLAALQPDELEHLVDSLALSMSRDAVQLGEVAEVVVGGKPLVEAAVAAEDVADPLAHLARVVDHVVAEHACLAARREEQGDQHLDRGRLARAVRAEQPKELALLDAEGDPTHGFDVQPLAADDASRRLVGPAQVDSFDHGHVYDPSDRTCHQSVDAAALSAVRRT